MEVIPVTLAAANEFVRLHHRHHKPATGHKFSIGVQDEEKLVGVAIAGRPVARAFDDGRTLEVTRSVTIGTPNVNSMLYGAMRRIARAMGYLRVITYTQDGETGASLRAAGWVNAGTRPPRAGWTCPTRPREDYGVDQVGRTLWEVRFGKGL